MTSGLPPGTKIKFTVGQLHWIGRGIGTAGIWIGIGMVGLGSRPQEATLMSFFALLATLVIWFKS